MPHSVSSEASIEDQELPDALSPAESPTTGESDAMDISKEDAPKKEPEVRLEELFNLDDDDDEFSSSAPVAAIQSDPISSSPPPLPA